jgi:HlyD family secretion protein
MANKASSIVWRWMWRVIKLALVIAIIGGIVFWVRFRPVAVVEHEASRGPIVSEVMGTGTLEARIKATISPKISGRIRQVFADQGDRVTAGQLLVQLDDAELIQQVAISEADVETRRAAITRLEADIARTTAILSQARTNYERLNSLIQANAVSRDELDKATEALAIAESESSRAEAALAEGRRALIVTERTHEFQKTRLLDARIKAPFDGLIVRRDRDPGDVVVPGSPVLSLISTDELWINAWVDETEMSRLQAGQVAKVVFRSEPETTLPGKLVRLGKEADRETREFVVDVEVLTLPANWAVGQRAEVFIETARKPDVVRIPNRFISRIDQQTGVFVNRGNVVAWQPVKPGLRGRRQVEIIDGIEPGQIVILPGNPKQRLRSGQRVMKR